MLYVLSVEITNQYAPSQTGEQNVKCRINGKLLKLSMFHSIPVHKSSQKVCRTSTALFMCHFSPICVLIVIFDVSDGTFRWQWTSSYAGQKVISLVFFLASYILQLGIRILKCVCTLWNMFCTLFRRLTRVFVLSPTLLFARGIYFAVADFM